MPSLTTLLVLTAAAAAGLAAAQSDSAIFASLGFPSCANQCFAEGVGNSSCSDTDLYCACTTGLPKIEAVAIPCLCKSSCTTEELLEVVQDTNKACSSALSASSMTFSAQTLQLSACETGAAGSGSSSTNTAASAPATTTTAGTASSATGGSGSSSTGGNSGSSTAATTAAASTSSSGADGMRMVGYEGAVIGLGALAALVV